MVEDRRMLLREKILEIASTIITTEGLSALQARRVAKEADCSVGTLYNVYGNLDRLVLAVNEMTLDRLRRALNETRASQTDQTIERKVDTVARAYLDFAAREKHAWRALFEHRLTTETVAPQSFRDKEDAVFSVFDDCVSDGKTNAETKMQSRAIFGAVHGIISLALDEKFDPFNEGQSQEAVAFIAATIARGLNQSAAA
ncbi:MAG: TetR/AcrR family transcriptional regulator [Pseudomonadota bacterium]